MLSTEAGALNGEAASSRTLDKGPSSLCLEGGHQERPSATTVGSRTRHFRPIRRSQESRLARTKTRVETGLNMSPWCKMMQRRK